MSQQETNTTEELGTSCPPQPEYNNYDERRPDNRYRGDNRGDNRGRGRGFGGRGRGRGRGGGDMRPFRRGSKLELRSFRRTFVLDFNRFVDNKVVYERIMGNFDDRMEKGDTKDLFYWASPQLNYFNVGETLSVRFNNETEISQYVVTAKFLRGEVDWKYDMPDNVKYDLRLKRIQ